MFKFVVVNKDTDLLDRYFLYEVQWGDCRVAEILQVVIQNSGSFGRKLGNLEVTHLNVPNTRSQMFTLLFRRLK
jgi:hypothetical protein